VIVLNDSAYLKAESHVVQVDIDVGNVNEVKDLQLLNALLIEVQLFIVEGNVTDVKLEHPLNALAIVVTPVIELGRTTDIKLLQFRKAFERLVMVFCAAVGNITLFNIVQFEKALTKVPPNKYEEGISISVKLLHPENALDKL
jgi:hypothetical protein